MIILGLSSWEPTSGPPATTSKNKPKTNKEKRNSILGITEFLISYHLVENTKPHKELLFQLYLPISYKISVKTTPKSFTKS